MWTLWVRNENVIYNWKNRKLLFSDIVEKKSKDNKSHFITLLVFYVTNSKVSDFPSLLDKRLISSVLLSGDPLRYE